METFRNATIGGVTFPPFVVLNSQNLARDDATLLHEMIHAAHSGPVRHDGEKWSVFYDPGSSETPEEHIDRTWLKPEHAVTLSKSFFALRS